MSATTACPQHDDEHGPQSWCPMCRYNAKTEQRRCDIAEHNRRVYLEAAAISAFTVMPEERRR